MERRHVESAMRLRAAIARGEHDRRALRAALLAVPPVERDAWLDRMLALDEIPDDGPDLPRGGVPYLPSPVDALLRACDLAAVDAEDVFVDVGSGVGRACALVALLTGAATVGLEVQPRLVEAARALARRLPAARVTTVEGDAALAAAAVAQATVFFLYCPFDRARVERLLDALEPVARTRALRIACVDLPLPPRDWLVAASPVDDDLVVYRSTAHERR